MVQLRAKTRRALVNMLKDLSAQELRETADFVLFLRTRARIDPAQAYFWTSKWQAMERGVERDKRRGRILGNGSVKSLLHAIKA